MRVLIVDDSAAVRLLLRTLFSLETGVEVVGEAASGRELLAMVGDGIDPTVVVLDLSMPDMDGLEALSTIAGEHPQLPVVVYSGFTDPRVEQAARALGASDFVVKGTRPDELVRRVREAAGA